MTDEQIIKALEICENYKETCEYCPYDNIRHCADEIRKDTLNLIKRQQEEIEEKFETIGQQGRYIKGLKEENEKIKTKIYKMAIDKALAEKARAEAIKEFAHRLKILMETKAVLLNLRNDFAYSDDCVFAIVQSTALSTIDNLVKEMVGNSNA